MASAARSTPNSPTSAPRSSSGGSAALHHAGAACIQPQPTGAGAAIEAAELAFFFLRPHSAPASSAIRANISQPPPVSAALIRFSTAICQCCLVLHYLRQFMMIVGGLLQRHELAAAAQGDRVIERRRPRHSRATVTRIALASSGLFRPGGARTGFSAFFGASLAVSLAVSLAARLPLPLIGNSISRWPAAAFFGFLPLALLGRQGPPAFRWRGCA